eukprot:GHVT01009632.1.p1 GENE.GHVT01009632.1~~GHVT01009632.1.p1  ORF type:complete len:125 (+),score=5.51 GHVT01009632.1:422-796(+)
MQFEMHPMCWDEEVLKHNASKNIQVEAYSSLGMGTNTLLDHPVVNEVRLRLTKQFVRKQTFQISKSSVTFEPRLQIRVRSGVYCQCIQIIAALNQKGVVGWFFDIYCPNRPAMQALYFSAAYES